MKDKLNWKIEIPGYMFLILMFLSIWIDEYRWKLFFTGIYFMIVSILSFIVERERKISREGDEE